MMMLPEINLKEAESLDDLIHNDLKIIQNEDYFSFAIDAVLLANFTKVKRRDRIIDLGTGTGAIPLLLAAKSSLQQIIGVELQPELVDMAQRSVRYNNLEEVIRIKRADIKELKNEFGAESFDVVVSNPPYLPLGQGKVSPNQNVAVARHEIEVELADVVKISSYLVKYGGEVSYVYRPDRLDELLELMNKYRLQPKKLRLVYPKQNEDCSLVLVTGVKGGNPGLKIEPPLIVYQDDGEYTGEVLEIYYGSD